MLINKFNKKLIQQQDLTCDESYLLCKDLFDSTISEFKKAAILSLLAAKGESVDELLGFVKYIKEHSRSMSFTKPILEIVGTGGDGMKTLNISTASSLLVASCDIPVVKHGNRAVSSSCGTADILEELGYPINLSFEKSREILEKENFVFCFAPNYYPIFANIGKVRKELQFPTIFNLLGPILNPFSPNYILLGVYTQEKVRLLAETLAQMDAKRSLVFHGHGLDELSCLGTIKALLVENGKIEDFIVDPVALGLRKCSIEDLAGGNSIYNAYVITKTLNGIDTPLTDTLILNAAVALFIYGRVLTVADGVKLARERLAQGNILKVSRLQEIVNRKHEEFYCKRKSFKQALLAKNGKAIISEIKRASPSVGKIASIPDPAGLALEYVNNGAAAVSVLVDKGFEGSLDDLVQVTQALKNTNAAVLCKDIVVSPVQIANAAKIGADAILLMVSVLHNKTSDMVEIVHSFGLEALVEVHNIEELPIALNTKADVIGINLRDLTDFSLHSEVFSQLIKHIPANLVKIAESGIKTALDAKNAFNLGYDAVLVGETLSRLDKPADFFNEVSQC